MGRMAFSIAVIAWLLLPLSARADDREEERVNMVSTQIEARGVRDKRVLDAMRSVSRHEFVSPSRIHSAYEDRPLPIGYGQTISQPYIVAYMTEVIRPTPESRVLEIGTGSGYQAAVLSKIVKEVYTIEIITELAETAKRNLASYKNVEVRNADGYDGWKENAPFDAIVVTAAADHIPPPLVDQLKDGGRMIIPVGSAFLVQHLVLVEKKDGKTRSEAVMPVRFVPFRRGEKKD